jgi:hypothetical protein
MSREAFRAYYEANHRLIGEKYLAGLAVKYKRRYLSEMADPISAGVVPAGYDVQLEIWYPDRQTFDAANRLFAQPEVAAEIAADEQQLFDRSASLFYTLDEVQSQLPSLETV